MLLAGSAKPWGPWPGLTPRCRPTHPHPPTAPDAGPDGLAVIFPGQGSQAPGVGQAWVDHPAWSVVDRIEEAAGRPLRPLLLDPDADLSRTEDSQLSVLTASLVAWEAVRPHVDRPVAFAGHSLGQITALIASGAVSVANGVRVWPSCGPRSHSGAQMRRPGA